MDPTRASVAGSAASTLEVRRGSAGEWAPRTLETRPPARARAIVRLLLG